jgi:hypothetical protein
VRPLPGDTSRRFRDSAIFRIPARRDTIGRRDTLPRRDTTIRRDTSIRRDTTLRRDTTRPIRPDTTRLNDF